MYIRRQLCSELLNIVESSLIDMKRTCSSSSDEEPAKQRKVKHEMYKKWMTQYNPKYQTLTWLDCEMRVKAGIKVVIKLKCQVCTKFRDRIIGRRNFSDKLMHGADSV